MSEGQSVKLFLVGVRPESLTDLETVDLASRDVEEIYGGLDA